MPNHQLSYLCPRDFYNEDLILVSLNIKKNHNLAFARYTTFKNVLTHLKIILVKVSVRREKEMSFELLIDFKEWDTFKLNVGMCV